MCWKIQCRVDSIDLDGRVTISGIDGYRIERDGKKNVFWKFGCDRIMSADNELSIKRRVDGSQVQEMFQMLLVAKTSNSKVELDVEMTEAEIVIKNARFV